MWQQQIAYVNSNDPKETRHCDIISSWKYPLADGISNSLNPCFLLIISSGIQGLFLILTLYECIRYLKFNHYGPYRIKYSFGSPFDVKSVGGVNIFKFNCLFIQGILTLSLTSFGFGSLSDLRSLALLIQTGVLILGAIPLHVIEPTRSLVASSSLLFFWLAQVVLNLINLLQDAFSGYKIYIPNDDISIQTAIHVIEICLFFNSVIIFTLETFYYNSSKELIDYYELNEWDVSSVRSLFSRILFNYVSETIEVAGKENRVYTKHLPSYSVDCDNKIAYEGFLYYWNKSLSKWKRDQKKLKESTPSLFWPIFKLTFGYFIKVMFFQFLSFSAEILQPYLLRYFLLFATNKYVAAKSQFTDSPDNSQQPIVVGFAIATLIFVLNLIRYVSANRQIFNSQTLGDIARTALASHIYHKGMRLSPKERKHKSIGELINNMAQDVSTIQLSPEVIIDIILQPIIFVIYIYTIYNFLGIAAAAGLVSALVLIPLASACFKFIYKEIKTRMKYKDQRSKLMTEILTSIKSIKLYSWEKPMLERILEIRNGKELKLMQKLALIRSLTTFLWNTIPLSVSISTFVTAVLIGKVTLTPDIVFPALAIFDSLSQPVLRLPLIFQQIATARVSLERLSKLFVMEELEVEELERTFDAVRRGQESVTIKDATFLWGTEPDVEKPNNDRDEEQEIESANKKISPVALKDIDFSAKKGELSCIVGKVGSGKTTLLKAILGCIPVDSENKTPTLKVKGTIAYCAQNPWILNATVRENILFGRRYDKAFYAAIIEACELSRDREMLPDGDSTVVGEKGISLSGGQKARISLARAVYSKADIYILDDVLSAVDTHVGKKIIKNVLGKTGLLSSKTIILATNSVPVLHEAGSITLLVDGKITEQGTYDEVMGTDTQLAKLIKEFGKQGESEAVAEDEEAKSDVQGNITEDNKATSFEDEDAIQKYQPEDDEDLALRKVSTNVTVAPSFVSFGHSYDEDFQDDPKLVKKTGNNEENKNKGRVNLNVYKKYIEACGYLNVALYLICLLISILLSLSNTYILKSWSDENAKYGMNVKVGFFLTLYSLVSISSHAMYLISSIVLSWFVAINGSRTFHDNMAKSVLKSPMSFFETTPVGRILNRFTEDIGLIDTQIVMIISYFFSYALRAISVFSIVVYNLPFMVFVIVVLLFVYDHFRRLYIPASTELKRLRSSNKSPVYSHMQESLNGVDTINAYNQIERFTFVSTKNMNTLVKVEQANMAVSRWLATRLQGLSAIIVYSATLLILVSLSSKKPLAPGMVGFIMSYILDVTGLLNSIVQMYALFETRSVTIERIIEYINLKPEADMVIEDNRPDPNWPQHGAISFKDYETKYRENLDPVLKDINIDIKPGEKVGIVGRTGAGKSSLTLALFRIIEATKGHIEIDGIDTSKLGLFDLRSKLNIIPQDSHAIDGSVRENLDPFGKHTDDELWKALELSHLKEYVSHMKTENKIGAGEEDNKKKTRGIDDNSNDKANLLVGLDARVEEGGNNLSAGQKQLMCLARALLNKSKVLILDEATASVDVETDQIVQDTIRSEFKDKTILTIAHRIDTIMDSDRVLVLDKGTVKEFDSPRKLLEHSNGIFYLLCKQGGHI